MANALTQYALTCDAVGCHKVLMRGTLRPGHAEWILYENSC